MDLSNTLDDRLVWWRTVNISPQDQYIMAQIEAMLDVKWHKSQRISADLGIPFAIDSMSHHVFHEQDAEVFYRYFKMMSQGNKDIMMHSLCCGIHVQTYANTKHYMKENIVRIFGSTTNA